MGKGYIKLDRSMMDNWMWQEKPFSRAQAWIDLLLLASFKDSKEMYRGELKERKRGEVHCSFLYLADRWGWSRGKVNRFMAILKQDNMVTINSTTHDTTITIENYAKYQGGRSTNRTTDGTTGSTTDGQQTVQQTDTLEESKKKVQRMVKKGEEGQADNMAEKLARYKKKHNIK